MSETRPLLFTVDVESDWGTRSTRGLEEALPRLLERLEERDARATFFVVGELAPRLRRILPCDSPHEVGSHGHSHARLTRLSHAAVVREVEDSKAALESEGFEVRGFRAPFLRRPRRLDRVLVDAGFGYDASGGSCVPSLRNVWSRRRSVDGLEHLPPSTLRDRLTPFSLTSLRLMHPFGERLVSRDATVFFCHLHELIECESGGWHRLPFALRRAHARHCGGVARSIVDRLIADPERELITCSEYLRRPA